MRILRCVQDILRQIKQDIDATSRVDSSQLCQENLQMRTALMEVENLATRRVEPWMEFGQRGEKRMVALVSLYIFIVHTIMTIIYIICIYIYIYMCTVCILY